MAIRLESVLLEMERLKDDLLIVAHPTVLKCIYSYWLDLQEDKIVDGIQINANEVIELSPVAYGCQERRHQIPFMW